MHLISMYLNTVLTEVQNESAKNREINSEHLYKLNEAIFNLPEDDVIDARMAGKIFQGIQKIRTAYNTTNIGDVDENFFYDYLALLSTMQNQHFFSAKQTDTMLEFMKEGLDGGSAAPAPKPSKADDKKLQKLQEENERLRAEYESLKGVLPSVDVIKNFKLSAKPSDGKGKSKGKDNEEKGKGKGKGKDEADEEEEPKEEKKGRKRNKRRSRRGKSKEDDEGED